MPSPCSLQTAGMPWVWPQVALQTLRSQPRGSMVSSWRAGGVRAASACITHAFACPKFCCTESLVVESFLHPCPCQHPNQDLELSHMPGPLCQCSASLCVATKPQGDPVDGPLTTSGSTKGQQHPRVCALSLQGSGLLPWPGWTTVAPSMLGARTAAMPGSR